MCYSGGVHVRLANGSESLIEGRTAAIITWLVGQAERLGRPAKLKLEFDCLASEIKPRVTVIEDGITLKV